ncbi:MAG TPA: zinc-binding dehydrogenase [Nocardioides sp.]|nr:zinc-binding dehydrogenase [Nocardioides sp.]
MRAVTCQKGVLDVADVADPLPERGNVVLEVHACGICGSDLHARHHCDEMADDAAATGYDSLMRSDQSVVMGHEFCGEVVEHGPRTPRRLKPGTLAVSLPMVRTGGRVHTTGLSVHAPGAYAERVLTQEALTLPVPNGLPARIAAMTEPMAVALHAVRRGDVGKKQVAYVIGCGPIGLGVIAMLKATGVRTVVASDFSPGRRSLATAMGADVVVDPAAESPYAVFADRFTTADGLLELAVATTEKLRSVPMLPWWNVFRAADAAGLGPSAPVVFECVGVPGMINQVVTSAPIWSRVVVVGVCMGTDEIRPSIGINKEIDLRFVLGYTPDEFRAALHLLGDGKVDPSPLVTGTVGLDGVEAAFDALADPEAHAKILVDPRSTEVAV